MSFRAKKICVLVDFSFFLGILVKAVVKATYAGLNSFFYALNTAHSCSNARKTFSDSFSTIAVSKPQTREFFLCFVVKFFNSTVNKRLLFTAKETVQFSYMIWRE